MEGEKNEKSFEDMIQEMKRGRWTCPVCDTVSEPGLHTKTGHGDEGRLCNGCDADLIETPMGVIARAIHAEPGDMYFEDANTVYTPPKGLPHWTEEIRFPCIPAGEELPEEVHKWGATHRGKMQALANAEVRWSARTMTIERYLKEELVWDSAIPFITDMNVEITNWYLPGIEDSIIIVSVSTGDDGETRLYRVSYGEDGVLNSMSLIDVTQEFEALGRMWAVGMRMRALNL